MLTPADAEKLIFSHLKPFQLVDCPLAEAHGRVLRSDLSADRDLPPYDRVTLDGYALRAEQVAAGWREFRIVGVQAAGVRPIPLGEVAGTCVEIMTGAVLAKGADCIVPYEETTRVAGVITVSEAFAATLRPGNAVHRRGSDHPAGEVIVRAPRRLTGREIAVAASVGAASVTVAQCPKIAVIATGDELVDTDAAVAPHQIRRSNDYALRAALIAAGYTKTDRYHIRDMRHEIEHLIWHVAAEYDVVLITGGVSKGKFDFLPAELDAQGMKRVFHGVAQRPGKPFWFGVSAQGKPIFALPGNPTSAYTCLHRYVLPALAYASGLPLPAPRRLALAAPVTFHPPLAMLLPVRLGPGTNGETLAMPEPSNTSGDFGGLVNTDGFVELPADQTDFPAGYLADYRAWV